MTRATTGSSAAFPAFGATPTMFCKLWKPCPHGRHKRLSKRLDGIPLIASETAVLSMQAAGIDVVGFSNNHCFDYGKAGYDNSRAFFDSIGLTHAGAIPDDTQPDVPPYTVITAENGKKIGFIAITSVYSPETAHGGVLTTSHFMFYRYITASAQANDLTVVYLHSGNGYTAILDDKQQDVAHSIIDAGADMVIGSHPHNVQPVELYGNGIIFTASATLSWIRATHSPATASLFNTTNPKTGAGILKPYPSASMTAARV